IAAEMLQKYRNAGIRVSLSDFTLDTGIPTVGVLAWDPATFPGESEIVWTAGTTPDPQKALSRALSETAQLAGDFNSGSNYVASGLPKFKAVEEADFIIRPDREVDVTDLPNISHDNIRMEVENCISTLAAKEMEVIVVDITHPSLGAPAFYTIIPGAHFRERAHGASVGMYSAKITSENLPPAAAIEALTRMDSLLPDQYYIHFYIGTSRLALGDAEGALRSYEKALDLDPAEQDAPSIYSYMGVSLKEMERFPEALDVLKKGLALDSERIDILNLMGFCYFKLKAHEKAIDSFREVIRLNPSSAIDYANIASNYRELGKRDKAIKYYEMALAMDPSISFARDSLEKLLRQSL
ncbi:MAG: tetratricopeptide repeat protein, partial [Desulfobacterales bacterium]|nr:tetratricopeptide repeat protein [Desulfobacterales bacterium]